MWHKIIAVIEIWVGLSFVIGLISYIPVIGAAIGNFLGAIVGFIAQIPFYGFIMMLFGTAIFADGIIKIRT